MMEQSQENNVLDVVATAQLASVGSQLRAARERLGLSVDEVVAQIKISARQITALETDDFKNLPETAFVRGFVRSYARLLQLEAQPLLDALPGAKLAQPVESAKIEATIPSERTVRQQNVNLLIAALVVALGIAGFAVWQSNSPVEVPAAKVEEAAKQNASDEALLTQSLPIPAQAEMLDGSAVPEVAVSGVAGAAPASAVSPVATPVAAPVVPAVPAGSLVALRLVFDKEAWAEIKDKNGKPLSNQLNHAGSEVRVEGTAPFTLVVGHASSVHLFAREKPVTMTPNAYSDVARLTVE